MNNSRSNNRKNCTETSETTETPGLSAKKETTEIDIEANTSQQLQSRDSDTRIPQSTNIDMEFEDNGETNNEMNVRRLSQSSASSVQRNLFTLFSDARQQFARPHIHAYTLLDQNNGARNGSEQEHFDGNDNVGLAPRRNGFNQLESQNIHPHRHASTTPHFLPTPSSPAHSRNIRSWRMNLNNVLSFSSTPSTEAIRSLITNTGTFRYTPVSTSNADLGDNINIMLSQEAQPQNPRPRLLVENPLNRELSRAETSGGGTPIENNSRIATTTANSSGDTSINVNVQQENVPSTLFTNRTAQQNTGTAAAANNRNVFQDDEDNNVISDMFVKFLSHFVRYLPFICILFVKFIHDHLLGILDLLLLHGIMYQVNKSLREQVAKFSQKSYGVLLRDFSLVTCVIAYRFLLASSTPDPFGLLITPPSAGVTLELAKGGEVTADTKDKLAVVLSNYLGNVKTVKDQQSGAAAAAVVTASLENTVTITKAISLGVLLYYVAVNDLILKLLTILIKISITLMPTKVIRHKPRARMYVLVEYFSQFYRALAPLRQWLIFLFESYSGLEMISGILFSSFYMGAKGFEFVDRGKSFKKALINFIRNMDYERKPTKDELDASGSLCPICHDTYTTPIVLECGHIFCDDCVSTWFKREQTCPMCRANVSEDPTWQDGSTTFFYQLC